MLFRRKGWLRKEYDEKLITEIQTLKREWLNKKTKQGLVDYYFSNLSTVTNKAYYLKKTKKDLVEMILNHFDGELSNEAMEHIKG